MTDPAYKRIARLLGRNYANVAATLALVVALTGVGLVQAGVIVTTKQIKNGTIISKDIRKSGVSSSDIGSGAVRSADIQAGAVEGSDIGSGEVEPQDVTMPEPVQLGDQNVATKNVGFDFELLDTVGTYTKEDPSSVLEIDWTGTANAPASSCILQIRVDGQPAADGAGQVYVTNVGSESTTSVSVSALFPSLAAGPHVVEIWARINNPGFADPCIVGPAQAGIPQNFVITEQIV